MQSWVGVLAIKVINPGNNYGNIILAIIRILLRQDILFLFSFLKIPTDFATSLPQSPLNPVKTLLHSQIPYHHHLRYGILSPESMSSCLVWHSLKHSLWQTCLIQIRLYLKIFFQFSSNISRSLTMFTLITQILILSHNVPWKYKTTFCTSFIHPCLCIPHYFLILQNWVQCFYLQLFLTQ